MAVAMTASQAQAASAGVARKTFETLNPATGQLIAAFPVAGREEAAAAVSRAREAARWWAGWAGGTAQPPAGLEVLR